MRDSTQMFDHDADSADDLTREFWGAGASWVPDDRVRQQRAMQVHPTDDDPTEYRLDHTPTSMRAVREGIAAFKPKRRWRGDATGPVERTRQHGQVRSDTPAPAAEAPPSTRRPSAEALAHSRASIADLAAGTYDEYDDYDLIPATPRRNAPAVYESRRVEFHERPAPTDFDDDLIALTPATLGGRLGLGDVDPAVVRVGIVLLALVLALPLALAMRDGDDASGPETPGENVPAAEQVITQTGAGAQPAAAPPIADPTAASPTEPSSGATESSAEASAFATEQVSAQDDVAAAGTSPESATAPAAPSVDTRTAQADELTDSSSAGESVAVVEEPAERIAPDCSLNYTAGPGDSWYRIADEAGVTPSELVAQNLASLDTVILPGDEICLPAGSTMPSAPTTATPTTTEAPSTTATPTTQAPTTTAAPTTTVAPSRSYSTAEVQAMIRETWPEDQHEKALQVAWRESNYVETADNGWCCVGVFQMYWTVHQSWLDDYGIYTRDDLKDGRKNIAAAYALYQRSGGWGPWGG